MKKVTIFYINCSYLLTFYLLSDYSNNWLFFICLVSCLMGYWGAVGGGVGGDGGLCGDVLINRFVELWVNSTMFLLHCFYSFQIIIHRNITNKVKNPTNTHHLHFPYKLPLPLFLPTSIKYYCLYKLQQIIKHVII